MSTAPKVSVLIPSYNYGHLLDETIESVLAQTYNNYELLIVDNCSSDNTQEVVQKYLTDPRVRYYKNEKNIGLSGNWNRCLELAKGEYIKFLCADDKFHPLLLEKYVKVMDSHPNVSIITCHKEMFGSISKPQTAIPPFEYAQDGRELLFHMLVFKNNFLGDPTRPMFRRTNLHAGPFKNLEYVTDWEMWNRQLVLGDGYAIPEVLAYGRKHPGQQQARCKKFGINHIENYMLYKAVQNGEYGDYFKKYDKELDQMVKLNAVHCAFRFYKLLPKIFSKPYRKSIKKLFSIAQQERTLFSPDILQVFSKKLREKKFAEQQALQEKMIQQPLISLNDNDRQIPAAAGK